MKGKQTDVDAKRVVLEPCDLSNNEFKWTLKSTMRKDMIEKT